MRFLADENLNGDLIRGLRRRKPDVDILRVQDLGLGGADDPTVLARSAELNRLLLTHDVRTVTAFAYDRVQQHLPMPGVIEVPSWLSLATVIDELLLIVECGVPSDFENQVRYLPL